MEYRYKCNVCGQVFCFTDYDVKNSNLSNTLSAIASIGAVAGALSGNMVGTRINQAESHYQSSQVMDFEHCPNCHSADISLIDNNERNVKRIESGSIAINATPETLLKRVLLFIEEEDWNSADSYIEQALDLEPENGTLYFYKLFVDNRVKSEEELISRGICNFEDDINARRILKYGDDTIKSRFELIRIRSCEYFENTKKVEIQSAISEYELDEILQKNSMYMSDELKNFLEIRRKDLIYKRANELVAENTKTSLQNSIEMFERILGWKDSDKKLEQARAALERVQIELDKANQQMENRVAIGAAILVVILILIGVLSHYV